MSRWAEYFEDLLNPTYMPSIEEAKPGNSGSGWPISGDQVTEVLKEFLSGKALGVDEICPSFLRLWML